jgi:hypothetical protein
MFDLSCEPQDASIKTNPDGGITYSVICKSVSDKLLARLPQPGIGRAELEILDFNRRRIMSAISTSTDR